MTVSQRSSVESSLDTGLSDLPFSNSSRSTAPTELSLRPTASRGETWPTPAQRARKVSFDDGAKGSSDSVRSCASTASSEHDLVDHVKASCQQENGIEVYPSAAIPATSQEFADLFPSTRRLNIVHDDASSDGNMGLRVECKDRGDRLILFYLRMHDLRTREFSLRRYCRDSGREVCHSSRQRRHQRSSAPPTLSRSLSSFLGKVSSSKAELKVVNSANLKRHDSGYSSIHAQDQQDATPPIQSQRMPSIADLTDKIILEFGNYAHLSLNRSGLGSKKHYGFDYWGREYSWKRVVRTDFGVSETSYHLIRHHDKEALAHLVPIHLTAEEEFDEQYAGGWVPPSSFWLNEGGDDISPDLGDIIVATGLLTLVDETIRKRFRSKETRPTVAPGLAKFDPRKIIDEAFGRHSRPQTAH